MINNNVKKYWYLRNKQIHSIVNSNLTAETKLEFFKYGFKFRYQILSIDNENIHSYLKKKINKLNQKSLNMQIPNKTVKESSIIVGS